MSDDALTRRELLERMATALAATGLAACTRAPSERIVPYVVQPPEVTPGLARFYATASVLDGYATGILVESHEGRPTKVEGNPEHPASLGATGAFEQASVLSLYDPCRARGGAFEPIAAPPHGRGLHVVLPPSSSPTLGDLLATLRERLPEARVWFDTPARITNAWEGARIAFGRVLEPRYDLAQADVVVALDADFLASGPAHLRLAHDFAKRRAPGASMNRLYVVEPLLTPTGAIADHRLRLRAHDVGSLALALLRAVGAPLAIAKEELAHAGFIVAMAKDLMAHRGRSLVIAGAGQPPLVHAIAHAINAALDDVGRTVDLAPSPILEAGEGSHDLTALVHALERGEVDTLLVATNVVYDAPADRPMRDLLRRARRSVYVGRYEDETAAACTTVVAEAHPLEAWCDARAYDGTVSIVQPLTKPLFGGRTLLDVLAELAGRPASAHDLVRARFADERTWRRALRRGITDDAPLAPVPVAPSWERIGEAIARRMPSPHGLEIVFPLDPRVHDGRFANNGWLLELPAPLSKLTWTNAATIAPATAARRGIVTGDELTITAAGRRVRAAALIAPGQAEDTIGLSLGWGRSGAERLARGLGTNANALRTWSSPTMALDVTIAKTGTRRELAITQAHQQRDALPPKEPATTKRPLPLYEPPPRTAKSQWAMAIDLSICTGCSACVVACQAENNVPTVGESGVLRGRAMHWLRIDTYFDGDVRDPSVAQQPMLCQHCEKAPCEYVCPVGATAHSQDGLNQMVYNRCVGTRFCSHNCPYKVRRFNWFDYHRHEGETEILVHNPDVTVRERGVMEKCTFCVQRIREHEARPGRPLQTACQQACPTRAIVFGDKADPASDVARLHADPRSYAELDDLGTFPRVRYLRRVKNENPELA